MPVYVEVTDGATLSGLQFRALVASPNGAPPPTQAPQFTPDASVSAPSLQQSFQPGEMAFGWSLGSFNLLPLTSNYLGLLTFTIPPTALPGQVYSLSFANVDGSPDLQTQYQP